MYVYSLSASLVSSNLVLFYIQSDNLWPLVGIINPFIFNAITDICGIKLTISPSAIWLAVLVLLSLFFLAFFGVLEFFLLYLLMLTWQFHIVLLFGGYLKIITHIFTYQYWTKKKTSQLAFNTKIFEYLKFHVLSSPLKYYYTHAF